MPHLLRSLLLVRYILFATPRKYHSLRMEKKTISNKMLPLHLYIYNRWLVEKILIFSLNFFKNIFDALPPMCNNISFHIEMRNKYSIFEARLDTVLSDCRNRQTDLY